MGYSYDLLITHLEGRWADAEGQTSTARWHLNRADSHWGAGDDHLAIEDLMKAVFENNQAIESVLAQGFFGWPGDSHALLNALNRSKACPFIDEAPESEVTMALILSAMITADFTELQTFIGLVDAYRVSLWNEPFNAEYYAALARGFTP